MVRAVDRNPRNVLRPFMPELDSLRGVAVLLVIFFHGFGFKYRFQYLTGWPRLFVAATMPGWVGVNLFFVLSGFLITGILFDSKVDAPYYSRFYRRRALRILPAYYALLLFLLIVPLTGLFAHRPISWQFVVLSAFYLANLTNLFGIPPHYLVLWSLAVEEHFYMLWPAVVKNVSRRGLIYCSAAVVVVCPALRVLAFGSKGLAYGYTWLVADGLALGALLALLLRGPSSQQRIARNVVCFGFGAACLIVAVAWSHGVLFGTRILGASLRPTVMNLFFMATVALALLIGTGPNSWLANWVGLRFFGRISYGLYLIHMLAFDFVDHFFEKYYPGTLQGHFGLILLRFCIAAGLAILIAYLSRSYFEEWFLRLKSGRSKQSDALAARAAR